MKPGLIPQPDLSPTACSPLSFSQVIFQPQQIPSPPAHTPLFLEACDLRFPRACIKSMKMSSSCPLRGTSLGGNWGAHKLSCCLIHRLRQTLAPRSHGKRGWPGSCSQQRRCSECNGQIVFRLLAVSVSLGLLGTQGALALNPGKRLRPSSVSFLFSPAWGGEAFLDSPPFPSARVIFPQEQRQGHQQECCTFYTFIRRTVSVLCCNGH